MILGYDCKRRPPRIGSVLRDYTFVLSILLLSCASKGVNRPREDAGPTVRGTKRLVLKDCRGD
jgi:hypothetical protein